MPGTVRLIFLVSAVCALVSACEDRPLFRAPPRGSAAVLSPPSSSSVVTLVASLPYATLAAAGDAKIPRSTPIGGGGPVACLNVPYLNPGHVGSHQQCFDKPYLDGRGAGMERVCVNVPDFYGPSIGTQNQCADYNWHANVDKEGPLRVARSGTDVRVTQPIHIYGQAGLGGDLARALSLQGKNIDVHVSAMADIGLGLDKRWCPIVKAVPIGRWIDSATAEVVGRNCVGIDLGPLGHPELCAGPVNLGLADILNDEFDKHRGEMERQAQSALPCEAVRTPIADQWRPLSIKVDRGAQAPLFLNIEPKSAGVSDLIAGSDAMKVVVRVGVTTTLSPSAIATTAVELPPLDKVAAETGGLEINLQAVAPYEYLLRVLKAQLSGARFTKTTAAGTVDIRITDIDLYPSNGSLALGLKIDAKTPGRWFNTAGWVYLVGKPVPAAAGKAVSVKDLSFATVLDNNFWTVVSDLFQGEILTALTQHAVFDLQNQIDDASAEIVKAVANANIRGLKITAGPPSIALASVDVASDNLVATAKLDMKFDTELTAELLK